VVHEWLLNADRNHGIDSSEVEALRDRFEKLRGWLFEQPYRLTWATGQPPVLCRVSVEYTNGNPKTLTIVASEIGRFVTMSVPGLLGSDFRTIADEGAGSRFILDLLVHDGWRYVPRHLLGRAYDGVEPWSSYSSWGDRLFGPLPTDEV
jgi:hypothetical protein